MHVTRYDDDPLCRGEYRRYGGKELLLVDINLDELYCLKTKSENTVLDLLLSAAWGQVVDLYPNLAYADFDFELRNPNATWLELIFYRRK